MTMGVVLGGGCGDGRRLSNDVTPEAATHRLASYEHTCAIRQSGLFCWGYDSLGQLGTGTTADGFVGPVEAVVAGADAVEVAVGTTHTCVRHASGQVSCWGGNNYGQLGGGTVSPFSTDAVTVPGIDDALEVAAGFDSTCVRRTDGTVACWGAAEAPATNPGSLVPVAIRGLTDVVQLVGSNYDYCARQGDGNVSCWTFSYNGPGAPAPAGLPAAREMSAAHTVCVVSAASGEVVCHDDAVPPPSPVPGLTNPIKLSAGETVTCALDANGGVTCLDIFGFLAQTTVTGQVIAFPADIPAVDIAVGAFGFCALRGDDSIACLTEPATTLTPVGNLPP